ncbi:hypothetical protein GW17_00034810 [Ensete ventricosum]|nr:hypothetical protein GW17_00034810 [Ensete ventricosum]RZR96413.1 hypothetical protein BHM03_00025429 [Ensete ventricosum]
MAASATASCSLRSHGGEATTAGWRWLRWQRRARFDSYDRGDYGDGGKAATSLLFCAANGSTMVEVSCGGSRQLCSSSRGPRLWLKKRVVAMAEEERERTTV